MTSREPAAPGPGRPSGTDVPEVFAVDETFDADRLYALRATLSAHMSGFGTPAVLIDRLLIVASELATNAVRHGGGHGRLRLWSAGGGLFCEVTDDGPGFADPGVGGSAPGPTAAGGRGMWICRQLCDDLVIDARQPGTTVTAFLGPLSGDGRAT